MANKKSISQKTWVPLGGSSRKYKNSKTGEVISRYKYDTQIKGKKESHILAKENKKKNPKLAKARPAPNRKSSVKEVVTQKDSTKLKQKARLVGSVKGDKSRHFQIPVRYVRGEIDFNSLAPRYDAFYRGLSENKRVYGSAINITYKFHGLLDTKNLFPLRTRNSLPTTQEFIDELNYYLLEPTNTKAYKISGLSLADLKITSIDFYVVFTSAEMEKYKK